MGTRDNNRPCGDSLRQSAPGPSREAAGGICGARISIHVAPASIRIRSACRAAAATSPGCLDPSKPSTRANFARSSATAPPSITARPPRRPPHRHRHAPRPQPPGGADAMFERGLASQRAVEITAVLAAPEGERIGPAPGPVLEERRQFGRVDAVAGEIEDLLVDADGQRHGRRQSTSGKAPDRRGQSLSCAAARRARHASCFLDGAEGDVDGAGALGSAAGTGGAVNPSLAAALMAAGEATNSACLSGWPGLFAAALLLGLFSARPRSACPAAGPRLTPGGPVTAHSPPRRGRGAQRRRLGAS